MWQILWATVYLQSSFVVDGIVWCYCCCRCRYSCYGFHCSCSIFCFGSIRLLFHAWKPKNMWISYGRISRWRVAKWKSNIIFQYSIKFGSICGKRSRHHVREHAFAYHDARHLYFIVQVRCFCCRPYYCYFDYFFLLLLLQLLLSFVLFVCLPSLYVVFLSFITSVNMVPFENGDFGIDVDRHLNTHKHPYIILANMRDASTNCKCIVQIIHCVTVMWIHSLVYPISANFFPEICSSTTGFQRNRTQNWNRCYTNYCNQWTQTNLILKYGAILEKLSCTLKFQ